MRSIGADVQAQHSTSEVIGDNGARLGDKTAEMPRGSRRPGSRREIYMA
jgi:hypothetical protein